VAAIEIDARRSGMSRKLRSVLGLGLAALIGAVGAQTASADGLPVPFDGGDNVGVAGPQGGVRYATVAAGDRTVAVRTGVGTGEIQSTTTLDGDWGVPLVAYDGTPSGLSADGRTLALIQPRTRFPRASTSFAFLDTARMRVRDRLTLRGDYSFDALSPDGGLMYVIHYSDPRDPTAYEVRAYDLRRNRLLADPIVDPNESGEEMAGLPQTRAVSPDGRWAYTLYARVGRDAVPFIHALDTRRATAVCIDLDQLADQNKVWRYSLQPSPDGSSLAVTDRGESLANVDLASFEVSAPPTGPEPAAVAESASGGGAPWALIGGATALVAGAGALMLFRRRRHPGEPPVDGDELESLVSPDAADDRSEHEAECEPVR
jgi:hypothetical protein